jgi:hypothetical protein
MSIQQAAYVAHRIVILVIEHHRLIAIPDGFSVRSFSGGLEVNQAIRRDGFHELGQVSGMDIQMAFLVTTPLYDEILLARLPSEAIFEVSENLRITRTAFDIEHHVVAEGREDVHALMSPFQLPLADDLAGDIDH